MGTVTDSELILALWQARYVLKDYNAKQPGCGLDKLAVACEMAANRLCELSPDIEP